MYYYDNIAQGESNSNWDNLGKNAGLWGEK